MTDQPPPDPVEPQRYVSEAQVRARALADVMRDQAERADAARLADEARAQRARARRRVLLGTWAAAALVWLTAPFWLRVPEPVPQTVADEALSLRLNVFLQSQAIEAYRRQNGRLPFILQEAGPPFHGMEYRRFDSRSYLLQGRSERVIVRYHSDQPALDFVGSAAALLGDTLRSDGGMGGP